MIVAAGENEVDREGLGVGMLTARCGGGGGDRSSAGFGRMIVATGESEGDR